MSLTRDLFVSRSISINRKTLFLAISLALFSLQLSHAVVIDVGDGTGNTTAPDDDPGFANMGQRGVGSAIYLGNRWVMTAAHLRPGNVSFGGQEYEIIRSETVQLTNPEDNTDTETEETDLLLLRIEEALDLPALRLPCTAIEPGSVVTLIGRGHDREVNPSYWAVEEKPEDDDDVWTPVETADEADETGFRTLDSQTMRWGESLVNVTNTGTESSDFGDVLAFKTLFDVGFNVDNNAQGVRGDSGGSAFQKNEDVWELVGMIYSVDLLDNQPDSTRTAIYGDQTYALDIYQYIETLRDLADFEPDAGDINGDGVITALDIDAMLSAINRNSDSCHFDVDGSSLVDDADLSLLLASNGIPFGDTDLDGQVGFSDFLQVSNSFGQPVTGWAAGDFDGNGEANFADFLVVSESFGQALGGRRPRNDVTVAPVPEPAMPGIWLLLIASLFFAGRNKRPHRSAATKR